MAASDQRNFTVHMNMGSDDNKSSLRAARPAQVESPLLEYVGVLTLSRP